MAPIQHPPRPANATTFSIPINITDLGHFQPPNADGAANGPALDQLYREIASTKQIIDGRITYTLNADTITNAAVWSMIEAAIGQTELVISAKHSQGLALDERGIFMIGQGTFWGTTDSTEFFYISQRTDQLFQLQLQVWPSSTWQFSHTFPDLNGLIFDALTRTELRLVYQDVAGRPRPPWLVDASFAATGPATVYTKLISSAAPIAFHGTIAPNEHGQTIVDLSGNDTYPMTITGLDLADAHLYLLSRPALDGDPGLRAHFALSTAIRIDDQQIALQCALPTVNGLADMSGTCPPVAVDLNQLDLWHGTADLKQWFPKALQANPQPQLTAITLYINTATAKVARLTYALKTAPWPITQPANQSGGLSLTMAEPTLFLSAAQLAASTTPAIAACITGALATPMGNFTANALWPQYLLQAELDADTTSLTPFLTNLAPNTALPSGLSLPATYGGATLTARAESNIFNFDLGSEVAATGQVGAKPISLDSARVGFLRVNVDVDQATFETLTVIGGTIEIATTGIDLSATNPASGDNWCFQLAAHRILPALTDLVGWFDAQWSAGLPSILADLRANYRLLSFDWALAPTNNRIAATAAPPSTFDGWQLPGSVQRITFTQVILHLLQHDTLKKATLTGQLSLGDKPILLVAGLPFDEQDYEFVLAPDPTPLGAPTMLELCGFFDGSWQLPAVLTNLGNNVHFTAFDITVSDNVNAVVAAMAPNQPVSWTIDQGLVTLENFRLSAWSKAGQARPLGLVAADLPLAATPLPLCADVPSAAWNNFTFGVNPEAVRATGLPPLADLVSFFDPTFVSQLPPQFPTQARNYDLQQFWIRVLQGSGSVTASLAPPAYDESWRPFGTDLALTLINPLISCYKDTRESSGECFATAVADQFWVQLSGSLHGTVLTGTLGAGQLTVGALAAWLGRPVDETFANLTLDTLTITLDYRAAILTLAGNVIGQPEVAREDPSRQLNRCSFNNVPAVPEARFTTSRLHARFANSQAELELHVTYASNSGLELPGVLSGVFTTLDTGPVPMDVGDLSHRREQDPSSWGVVPFPVPVAPTPDPNLTLDDANQYFQARLTQGLSRTQALFELQQVKAAPADLAAAVLVKSYQNLISDAKQVTEDLIEVYLANACDPEQTARDVSQGLSESDLPMDDPSYQAWLGYAVYTVFNLTIGGLSLLLENVFVLTPAGVDQRLTLIFPNRQAFRAALVGWVRAGQTPWAVTLAYLNQYPNSRLNVVSYLFILIAAFRENGRPLALNDQAHALAVGGFPVAAVARAIWLAGEDAGTPPNAATLGDALIQGYQSAEVDLDTVVWLHALISLDYPSDEVAGELQKQKNPGARQLADDLVQGYDWTPTNADGIRCAIAVTRAGYSRQETIQATANAFGLERFPDPMLADQTAALQAYAIARNIAAQGGDQAAACQAVQDAGLRLNQAVLAEIVSAAERAPRAGNPPDDAATLAEQINQALKSAQYPPAAGAQAGRRLLGLDAVANTQALVAIWFDGQLNANHTAEVSQALASAGYSDAEIIQALAAFNLQSLLVMRDNLNDTGTIPAPPPAGNSPDLILRHHPLDAVDLLRLRNDPSSSMSDLPAPGDPLLLYVRLENRGTISDTPRLTLRCANSANLLAPERWEPIATWPLNAVAPGDIRILGPFAWQIPTTHTAPILVAALESPYSPLVLPDAFASPTEFNQFVLSHNNFTIKEIQTMAVTHFKFDVNQDQLYFRNFYRLSPGNVVNVISPQGFFQFNDQNPFTQSGTITLPQRYQFAETDLSGFYFTAGLSDADRVTSQMFRLHADGGSDQTLFFTNYNEFPAYTALGERGGQAAFDREDDITIQFLAYGHQAPLLDANGQNLPNPFVLTQDSVYQIDPNIALGDNFFQATISASTTPNYGNLFILNPITS